MADRAQHRRADRPPARLGFGNRAWRGPGARRDAAGRGPGGSRRARQRGAIARARRSRSRTPARRRAPGAREHRAGTASPAAARRRGLAAVALARGEDDARGDRLGDRSRHRRLVPHRPSRRARCTAAQAHLPPRSGAAPRDRRDGEPRPGDAAHAGLVPARDRDRPALPRELRIARVVGHRRPRLPRVREGDRHAGDLRRAAGRTRPDDRCDGGDPGRVGAPSTARRTACCSASWPSARRWRSTTCDCSQRPRPRSTKPRSRIARRTSSSRCSATSCATRWRRSSRRSA